MVGSLAGVIVGPAGFLGTISALMLLGFLFARDKPGYVLTVLRIVFRTPRDSAVRRRRRRR